MEDAMTASVKTPTAGAGPRRPHFNALTHGLRSGHVLLPGDDVAAFRKLRQRLFHLHKPRTIAEAQHVETLAVNAWRKARCRAEQRFFKEHLGAAMDGHADTGGYLCSPDLHRLYHRGTDCQNEERHLERSSRQAEAALAELQKQRTLNLTFGVAEVLEDYAVFLAEGEPVVEDAEEAAVTAEADVAQDVQPQDNASGPRPLVGRASLPGRTLPASASADGGNSRIRERTAASAPPRFPKHWSRRQREAALRGRAAG
jgi:hypothetical protein